MDNYFVEILSLDSLEGAYVSIVDLVASAPVSAADKIGKPIYAMLCDLRDSTGRLQLVDTTTNENSCVAYLTAYPGYEDILDQLDRVSALCSDDELQLLTRVALRLTRKAGVPGLAID